MTPGRQLWTLVAACFGQFMILLDITIVNVALPSIQQELDVSAGNLVWTINAYTVPLASLILVGGGLGDRYGRKRIIPPASDSVSARSSAAFWSRRSTRRRSSGSTCRSASAACS